MAKITPKHRSTIAVAGEDVGDDILGCAEGTDAAAGLVAVAVAVVAVAVVAVVVETVVE